MLKDAQVRLILQTCAYGLAIQHTVRLRPGCSHCGDPLTEATRLTRPGQGELLEFVTIHVPLMPGMNAPAIAGDIRLAEGIVEEGVIAVKDESVLRTGLTLKAVADVREALGVYACVFVPMNEGAPA